MIETVIVDHVIVVIEPQGDRGTTKARHRRKTSTPSRVSWGERGNDWASRGCPSPLLGSFHTVDKANVKV